MSDVFVSIIIVTFNSSKTIEKCVRSIYENHQSESIEVLIADNNSHDNTVDILQSLEHLAELRIIKNNRNLGFGSAINSASRHASGEYLYLVNPDVYFIEPVLQKYRDFMSGTPQAAACTGVLYEDGLDTVSTTVGNFPGLFSVIEDLGFHLVRRYLNARKLKTSKSPHAADYISGASVFIKRSLFEAIGGFDENFFLYFEETDLFFRLARELNIRPYVLPGISIVHIGGYSTGRNGANSQLSKIFLESRYYFFQKHFSRFVAQLIQITDSIRAAWKS